MRLAVLVASVLCILLCIALFVPSANERGRSSTTTQTPQDSTSPVRDASPGTPSTGDAATSLSAPSTAVEGTRVEGLAADARSEEAVTAEDPAGQRGTIPIVYDHPILVHNVEKRQEALRMYLPYLRLEVEGATETDITNRTHLAARFAVLTILDATGRAKLRDPSAPPRSLPMSTADVEYLANGNAHYEVHQGEFPAYDEVRRVQNDFGGTVPIAELPLEETVALVERALQYRTTP